MAKKRPILQRAELVEAATIAYQDRLDGMSRHDAAHRGALEAAEAALKAAGLPGVMQKHESQQVSTAASEAVDTTFTPEN